MKKKQVWRYYCDHCGKGGCGGGHIRRHEQTCTANPNRACRMCGTESPNMEALVSRLTTAQLAIDLNPWHGRMKALREATEDCPACILAAIRQSKVQQSMADGDDEVGYNPTALDGMTWDGYTLGFNFKTERDRYLAARQEER